MEGIAIQRQGVAGSGVGIGPAFAGGAVSWFSARRFVSRRRISGHGCLSRLAGLLQESPWHGGSTDALAADSPLVSRNYFFLNKSLVL